MDEMKIKLRTNLLRNLVSKALTKAISKKLGFKPELKINSIDIEKVGDKIQLHVDLDAGINEKDLLKVTKLIDEDESE